MTTKPSLLGGPVSLLVSVLALVCWAYQVRGLVRGQCGPCLPLP